ncbi:hypothetical protein NLP76_24375, partial [Escherichia coli]|nr:hypothetical protein [Escherichia coli]
MSSSARLFKAARVEHGVEKAFLNVTGFDLAGARILERAGVGIGSLVRRIEIRIGIPRGDTRIGRHLAGLRHGFVALDGILHA